jgi:hypothetical protein
MSLRKKGRLRRRKFNLRINLLWKGSQRVIWLNPGRGPVFFIWIGLVGIVQAN